MRAAILQLDSKGHGRQRVGDSWCIKDGRVVGGSARVAGGIRTARGGRAGQRALLVDGDLRIDRRGKKQEKKRDSCAFRHVD